MEEEIEGEELSQVDEVAALLSEAAETHALVYRITDGEDSDWASWYAKWLLELSEFSDLVGVEVPPSQLIYELVRLERDYDEVQPDDAWELYYAERLIEEFAAIDLEDEDDEDDEIDEDDEDEDPDADEIELAIDGDEFVQR